MKNIKYILASITLIGACLYLTDANKDCSIRDIANANAEAFAYENECTDSYCKYTGNGCYCGEVEYSDRREPNW